MRLATHMFSLGLLALMSAACSGTGASDLAPNEGVLIGQEPDAGAASEAEETSQSPERTPSLTADAERTEDSAEGVGGLSDAPSAPDSATGDVSIEVNTDAEVAPPPGPEPEGDALTPTGSEDTKEGAPGCAEDEVVDCLGACAPASALGDGACDEALKCEALNLDEGDCAPTCGDGVCDDGESYALCPSDCPLESAPSNHPCESSSSPGAAEESVVSCVCALDMWCCTNTWDAFCVQLAEEACDAMCDCSALTCTTDEGCGGCFGNACVGEWVCVDGLCAQGEPVSCDPSVGEGCLVNQCEVESGACVLSALDVACDDSSACTLDACDAESGLCVYSESGLCGSQHPCLTSELPGSGDADLQSCVCALDPYCCESAWDQACVEVASLSCGLECNCETASDESLACSSDDACAFCGEDLCTGPYHCVEGLCVASAPVVCDTSEDTACTKSLCSPESGGCELISSDAFCDDGAPCTLDACDTASGACSYTPIAECGKNHPCEESTTPTSSSPEVTACVCALESSCCSEGWSELCVALSAEACAQSCDCEALDPEELPCESNAECAFCDDGDLCNGAWLCQEERCVKTAAVSCDSSGDVGCIVNTCVPSSGACKAEPSDAACDDLDPCTADSCEAGSGACVNATDPLCGVNHPCFSAPFPTSKDPEVTACVCEIDAYCCESAWDASCVQKAEMQCNAQCTCDDPESPTLCEDDEACLGCDDGDLCNGTWMCVEGVCQASGPEVSCPPLEGGGCLENSCLPQTGVCEAIPSAFKCDDADPCTLDLCEPDGSCVNSPLEGCTLTHPCAPATTPSSNDPAVSACVCAFDAWCCETSWDSVCVSEAMSECGAVCECADPASNATCASDGDCAWCSADLCESPFVCESGQCVAGAGPVLCDTSDESECLSNQCNPSTGACALAPLPGACDDEDPCTVDSCNLEGLCVNTPLEGCEGTPPFECLGTAEPSAPGCEIVASYEGCCDPWGRVTWCQDGQTYCIACQENPSCGWQSAQGYYDCGNAPEGDPSGESPMMCPAYGL